MHMLQWFSSFEEMEQEIHFLRPSLSRTGWPRRDYFLGHSFLKEGVGYTFWRLQEPKDIPHEIIPETQNDFVRSSFGSFSESQDIVISFWWAFAPFGFSWKPDLIWRTYEALPFGGKKVDMNYIKSSNKDIWSSIKGAKNKGHKCHYLPWKKTIIIFDLKNKVSKFFCFQEETSLYENFILSFLSKGIWPDENNYDTFLSLFSSAELENLQVAIDKRLEF